MNNFTFYAPTRFVFGRDMENEAGRLVREAGGTKEEDIPALVNVLCRGDGRDGTISGFVTLDEEDCANIYRLMI